MPPPSTTVATTADRHAAYTPDVMESLVLDHMDGNRLRPDQQVMLYAALSYMKQQPTWVHNCKFKVAGDNLLLVNPVSGAQIRNSEGKPMTSFHALLVVSAMDSQLPPDYGEIDAQETLEKIANGQSKVDPNYLVNMMNGIDMKLLVPPRDGDPENLTDNAYLHSEMYKVFYELYNKQHKGRATHEQAREAMFAGNSKADPIPHTNKRGYIQLGRKIAWAQPRHDEKKQAIRTAAKTAEPLVPAERHAELLEHFAKEGETYLHDRVAEDEDLWHLKPWSTSRSAFTYFGSGPEPVPVPDEDWAEIAKGGNFFAIVQVNVTNDKRTLRSERTGTRTARLSFDTVQVLGVKGQPLLTPRVRGVQLKGHVGDLLLNPDVMRFASERNIDIAGVAAAIHTRPPMLKRAKLMALQAVEKDPEQTEPVPADGSATEDEEDATMAEEAEAAVEEEAEEEAEEEDEEEDEDA